MQAVVTGSFNPEDTAAGNDDTLMVVNGQTEIGSAVIARYRAAYNATLEYPSKEASAMANVRACVRAFVGCNQKRGTSAKAEGYRTERSLMDCVAPLRRNPSVTSSRFLVAKEDFRPTYPNMRCGIIHEIFDHDRPQMHLCCWF